MKKLAKDIPLAHVYIIEFQKRCLPHARILVILTDQDKPRNPIEYDKIVCAEIPNPILQPRLHANDRPCMIHGSCDIAKQSAAYLATESALRNIQGHYQLLLNC